MSSDNICFLRNRFEAVAKTFAPTGRKPETSYLRVELDLKANQSTYLFQIAEATGTTGVERKLTRNDVFVVCAMGLFLKCPITGKLGAEPLMTYPIVKAGAATGSGFFPTADAEVVYSGSLSVKIGQTVNIEAMPTTLFRHVPESQKIDDQISQFNYLESAYIMPEQLILSGEDSVEISVTIPSFSGANYGDGKLVFMPFGYLVKGTAAWLKNQQRD